MDVKSPVNREWLKGKSEIMSYCRISEAIFDEWIERRMPAPIINGTYRAHTYNLNLFLIEISKYGSGKTDKRAK